MDISGFPNRDLRGFRAYILRIAAASTARTCGQLKTCVCSGGTEAWTYVNERRDVLEVVLIHGGVGSSQVDEVVVSGFAALQVSLPNLILSLHREERPTSER